MWNKAELEFVNQMMGQELTTEEAYEARGGISRLREWSLWVLAALLAASAVALRLPVMTTHTRLLLVTTLAAALFSFVVHVLRLVAVKPRTLGPAVFFTMLLITWAVLGSKPPDANILRENYIRRLHSYLGARFVYGGESNTAIDCSGLARAALWQSMLKQGIRQANPRLLGPALWKFWWRDVSAGDMGRGKYGYTRRIGSARKLAGYDTSKLLKGDLAVAGSAHVLIYYGDGKWIEANPEAGQVIMSPAPAGTKRPWFNRPVTFVRWWILEPRP